MAPLLAKRQTGLVLAGAAAVHAGLVVLGLPGWHCPIRHGLGLPCPGCGLSRAVTALFHADWQTSMTYHAFAPLFLVALIILVGVNLLPSQQRDGMVVRIDRLERRTRITAILLLAFVLYWLLRLLILGDSYIDLIIR